jgi:excisionase family DNA binding protein
MKDGGAKKTSAYADDWGGLVNVAEAAKLLSLSRTKLYGLMDSGQLEYCRIGRARRITRYHLTRFVTLRLTDSVTKAIAGDASVPPNPPATPGENSPA